MKYYKYMLYFLLMVVLTLMGENWVKESHRNPSNHRLESASVAMGEDALPESGSANGAVVASDASSIVTPAHDSVAPVHAWVASPESSWITIENDVLKLKIDPRGGQITRAELKQYQENMESDHVVRLVNHEPGQLLAPVSTVVDAKGSLKPQYSSTKKHEQLKGNKPLKVKLNSQARDGLKVEKVYTLFPGRYDIELTQTVVNQGKSPWQGAFKTAFIRQRGDQVPLSGKMQFGTYTGASYYTKADPYTKLSYKAMQKDDISHYVRGGWIAEQIRYFIAAWVVDTETTYHVQSRVYEDDYYMLSQVSPTKRLLPQETMQQTARLYLGPEIEENLSRLAPGLKLTIDYGWLWWLSDAIFTCMKWIYQLVGNWGWSIILVTLLIKVVLYRFSQSSYQSMVKMKALQPRIEALKAQHGDDKQAMGQAMMALYKREKVSPLGGCLPMVIQIPFFIALYYVLVESVQLHHAPFILWINDLSSKDPYYVLPLLMGVSMYFQQLMMPTMGDEQQMKVMRYGLPVVMTAVFINFPSGLVIYWVTNNLLSLLQQWWVTRQYTKSQARA